MYPDKPFTSAFIERAKTFYPKATFFEESPKQVKAKRSEEKKFLSTLDTFDSDTTEAVVAPKIDEDTPTTHE